MKPPINRSRQVGVRMAAGLWRRLCNDHLRPGKTKESMSFLFGRCVRTRDGYVVLLPDDTPYFPLGSSCYDRQSGGHVRVRNDVINGMLVEFARSQSNCWIDVHDHWFSDHARFSTIDDKDDLAFDCYLRERFEPMLLRHPEIGAPRKVFHLSIVLGRQSSAARVTDIRKPSAFRDVDQIVLVDEQWRTVPLATSDALPSAPLPANLARHDGMLTAGQQQALARMQVAVMGIGGLGSILAESLGRLGVGRLILVDPDVLDATNLNRWQGATPADVGQPKAMLLARRLRAMCPHMEVRAIVGAIHEPRSLLASTGADILVGGVDNDAARYVLNHQALQYMQPYFDAGVRIRLQPRIDFEGRYFAVIPGVTACVECKAFQLIDRDEVIAQLAAPSTVRELARSGYVVERADLPAPSAYVLNQRTAALLVQELLNFVGGWRPTATVAMESWRNGSLQRADRLNYPEAATADCPVCTLRIGRGAQLPLPKQTQQSGEPV